MDNKPKELGDYLEIWRRRKWHIILPALALLGLSAAVVMSIPSEYRSKSTILIEEQEVPTELVKSTVTSYADQRIQVISQQVMTRPNLWTIIDKFNLFEKRRSTEPAEMLLERLQKNIKLDVINADVIDRRSGNKTTATIAFTLAYDGETPEQAQKVANELTSLYLKENLSNRSQHAAETSKFLDEEARKLSEKINDIESRLASFKQKNIGRLPELSQLNLQLRDRTEAEVVEVDRQLSTVSERKFYLEGQLAQIKPNSQLVSATGERILDTEERIKALKAQYVTFASSYSPEHPDVIKLRKQIDALEASGDNPDFSEDAKQLVKLRGDLIAAQERYTNDHPDVIRLKSLIASAEASVARAKVAPAPLITKRPENPAYITLQAQLESANNELRSLKTKQTQLRTRLGDYETRLQQTPQVEREYLDLNRERENVLRSYQEIKTKLSNAQVAQELEKDSKGERFSLIDPPQLPERAERPNRLMLLLLGSLFSMGGGVAFGGIAEALDRAVRGGKALTSIVPVPLLANIPYIPNVKDVNNSRLSLTANVLGLLVVLSTLLLILHSRWMPLDVAWFVFLRKLGL